MELLPVMVEASSESGAGVKGDEGKGSNPTYILPVDPFNYFPFFNGFSNVNPFSQFHPPPPYLYPQYTNYMHRYASHGVGHAPAYPYPGAMGGAFGHSALGHGGMPYNYPHPNPHMHYPFGSYKLDVSGPDVRTGENNPPPFPQFTETAAEVKMITPEIIPKGASHEEEEEEEDSEEDAFLQTEEGEEGSDEGEVEIEDEIMAEDHGSVEAEIADEEADEESGEAEDVEIVEDEADSEGGMQDVQEFHEEESDAAEESNEVEYA